MQCFWCAHARALSSGMDTNVLHPKHLLLLWKQLVLSTSDTCLPFLHQEKHITRFGAAINASLACFFTPQVRTVNCLFPALKAELGMPFDLDKSFLIIQRSLDFVLLGHAHACLLYLTLPSDAANFDCSSPESESDLKKRFVLQLPPSSRGEPSKLAGLL
jgi:hypothetical protein